MFLRRRFEILRKNKEAMKRNCGVLPPIVSFVLLALHFAGLQCLPNRPKERMMERYRSLLILLKYYAPDAAINSI